MSEQTYADLLRLGAQQLGEAGLEGPVREARLLLMLAAKLSASDLITREMDPVSADHRLAFLALLDSRAARKPYAHISGQSDFYGLTLKSDARALIPRPDSEVVVDLALSLIPEAAVQIADLGTGTGALLAALLTQRAKATGVAIEASAAAASLASENFTALGLTERAVVVPQTWAAWRDWAACDLIISNPPYIRSHVIATLEPEVRDYDPVQALDGGADGLTAYREIIALAAENMKPGALLVFEIGYDQKSDVTALLLGAGFTNLMHKQDYGGQDRAIAATKS